MKQEITKLDVASVALVYGALLAVIGLFFALMFLGFGSMFGSMMGRSGMGMMMGGGVAMIILLPIVYGIFGLVFGAIFGIAYNVIAPRVGGIKLYIRDAVS